MKTERNGMFETNSSSSHSITLDVDIMMAENFEGPKGDFDWGDEVRQVKSFITPKGEKIIVVVNAIAEETFDG